MWQDKTDRGVNMNIKNPSGDVVGVIQKNVFTTHRKPEHFMRIYQGFGISESILKELKSKGADVIIIIYTGKLGVKKYATTLLKFEESDKEFIFEDYDKQKFVSVRDMEQIQ
jgi:predicted nucleotidyltransferase